MKHLTKVFLTILLFGGVSLISSCEGDEPRQNSSNSNSIDNDGSNTNNGTNNDGKQDHDVSDIVITAPSFIKDLSQYSEWSGNKTWEVTMRFDAGCDIADNIKATMYFRTYPYLQSTNPSKNELIYNLDCRLTTGKYCNSSSKNLDWTDVFCRCSTSDTHIIHNHIYYYIEFANSKGKCETEIMHARVYVGKEAELLVGKWKASFGSPVTTLTMTLNFDTSLTLTEECTSNRYNKTFSGNYRLYQIYPYELDFSYNGGTPNFEKTFGTIFDSSSVTESSLTLNTNSGKSITFTRVR